MGVTSPFISGPKAKRYRVDATGVYRSSGAPATVRWERPAPVPSAFDPPSVSSCASAARALRRPEERPRRSTRYRGRRRQVDLGDELAKARALRSVEGLVEPWIELARLGEEAPAALA